MPAKTNQTSWQVGEVACQPGGEEVLRPETTGMLTTGDQRRLSHLCVHGCVVVQVRTFLLTGGAGLWFQAPTIGQTEIQG